MKRFQCVCGAWLFFENSVCEQCNRTVGFIENFSNLTAFEADPSGRFYKKVSESASDNETFYVPCSNNRQYHVCNSFIVAEASTADSSPDDLCFACAFNNTIPDLSVPEHRPLWQKMETAKRRTLFTLYALGLEAENAEQNPGHGLSFEFITDRQAVDHFSSQLPNEAPVMTGHDNGRITINLAEADEVARTRTQQDLEERYRTLLGHFRHEIGHYFFDRLVVSDPKTHQQFKVLFGDDTQSYQGALEHHYQSGPPPGWQDNYISAYATMHPWEDWAETWAHYLHILDTLETAQSYGIALYEESEAAVQLNRLELPQDTMTSYFSLNASLDTILDAWVRLSVVLNALNRSMGLSDAYPFVVNDCIRQKLGFIHKVVQHSAA